jgi:hypothetical protein
MSSPRSLLLAKLRDEDEPDPQWARYQSLCRNVAKRLPYETLCTELDQIMAGRKVRQCAISGLQPKDMVTISIDEIDKRARVSEILVGCRRLRMDLGAVVDAMFYHLSATYPEVMRGYKTKGERDTFITSMLNKGYELLGSLDSLESQCSTILNDIDQGGFALKRIADMLSLVIRRENLVDVQI